MQKNLFHKAIILLLGSWYSIIIHTILFAMIIIVRNDLLLFNTIVSIEAIYIGIFILMAEYREEVSREKKEVERRSRDRKLVKEDVSLTQQVAEEIYTLKRQQEDISQTLSEIRSSLKMKPTTP